MTAEDIVSMFFRLQPDRRTKDALLTLLKAPSVQNTLCANFNQQYDPKLFLSTLQRAECSEISRLLMSSFSWGGSPEGYAFWYYVYCRLGRYALGDVQ